MKLRESFRFPYPVLNETGHDYLADRIDLSLSVEEKPASGALKIDYQLAIDSETINREISSGTSKMYLSVVCRDAFFNEFFAADADKGLIEVREGLLYGRVEVRAIAVRVADGYLEAHGVPKEYPSTKFEVSAGSVIAWTQPQTFTVGADKLAPMESIFHLSLDNSLEEGTFGISYDEEYISVRAPEKLLLTINAMRASAFSRPVVLNSIYLPAVMTVLEAFKNSGEFADRRWYRVIQAKAEVLGLDLVAGNPLDLAQSLLKGPAARLTQFMEKAQ